MDVLLESFFSPLKSHFGFKAWFPSGRAHTMGQFLQTALVQAASFLPWAIGTDGCMAIE